MKVSLLVTKGRAKYIVEQFGKDRVTVVNGDEDLGIFDDVDEIIFEVRDQLDFLDMFHAGIRCGMALNKEN
jgi:hypothetical protein